jgi:lipopolysaccharide transport system ATP-binding protein
MSDTVIKVENLGKKYIIGHEAQRRGQYVTLRDVISDGAKRFFSFGRNGRGRPTHEEIWALSGVSFEVRQGDRLGIIGRNGAGKSTLLKVLSRITEPTTGRIAIRGRVGSLLEVGTGFHQELTGRENIYLNGAVLGMSKSDIRKKFDEIVDFAEIEKFLDTPVKRYSSGMYVRLAFAVAAHLEPDILIVDEVLSVGDAEFQKKCLGKMQEVGTEGRTVLLVSHSMTTVKAIAEKAIYLDKGISSGVISVSDAAKKYLHGNELQSSGYYKVDPKTVISKDAYIVEAKLLNKHEEMISRIETCEPFFIEIKWVNKSGVKVNPNFMMVNQQGVTVMIASDAVIDWKGESKERHGTYVSRVKIPENLLNGGEFIIHLSLDCASPRLAYDTHMDALKIEIWDPMDERCLGRGMFTHVRDDAILWPALDWEWKMLQPEGVFEK